MWPFLANIRRILDICGNLLTDMTRKTLIILTAAALAAAILTPGCRSHRQDGGDASEKKDTVYPYGFLTDTLECVDGKVADGECFGPLMLKLGLPGGKVNPLLSAAEGKFDARKMNAGKVYEAYYRNLPDSTKALQYFVYFSDRKNMTVFRCFDSLAVWKAAKPTERRTLTVDVTINNSLSADLEAAGCPYLLTYALIDVYDWTVDFFALQAGDRIRAVFDEEMLDGRVIAVDSVRYAVFTHSGKDYESIMFNQKDGGNIYWTPEGGSMKKAFLKAPLDFKRISSGFSYHRKHPVTGRIQAHTAIDYAAPTGTPVRAIGDGTVLSAGYSGAAGNMIKIRHTGSYESAYLHLSKYAAGVKAGAHVRQGQVIGYVGSTGRSTGPHLDFRVWKNGQPVNPLKIDAPSLEPIRKENLPALDSLRSALAPLL